MRRGAWEDELDMENDRFPPIRERRKSPYTASYERKCLFHERLLFTYLKKKIGGWSVADFLKSEKIERYILYAVTDFTELVCDDLEKNGVCRTGTICDKRASGYPNGCHGWEVVGIPDMLARYKNGEADKIIVMSILHENEIMEELLHEGIALDDLISIASIIFWG